MTFGVMITARDKVLAIYKHSMSGISDDDDDDDDDDACW